MVKCPSKGLEVTDCSLELRYQSVLFSVEVLGNTALFKKVKIILLCE